ncbi:MAG TPA: cupin domain-containing protein [Acidobacteriaceae bacterium]|nr:cupin domain-containing protein [Acidobacteriaceae bacterium]
MATFPLLSDTPTPSAKLRATLHAVPAPSTIQVDGEAAESVISEKRIGERIKHLRLKKSMGLVELGRHTGLSASFLSQLETGRVVPTLRNLARISMVFSKDLNYFFEPEPRTLCRIHRAKDRVRLPQSNTDDPSYFFESLGYLVPDRQLDPYLAEFLPGKNPRSHQHFGCEFLYLLSGSLTLTHGAEQHLLEPGDAIYFDASTAHSYHCTADQPAPHRTADEPGRHSTADQPARALIVTLQQPVATPNPAPRTSAALPTQQPRRPASLPTAAAPPPQKSLSS